jgi:hypothetical protein
MSYLLSYILFIYVISTSLCFGGVSVFGCPSRRPELRRRHPGHDVTPMIGMGRRATTCQFEASNDVLSLINPTRLRAE